MAFKADEFEKILAVTAVVAAHKSQMIRHKTGAAFGNNAYKVSGYSHYAMNHTSTRTVHAEMHVIAKLTKKFGPVQFNSALYIATIRAKSGNIGNSFPCDVCMELLAESVISHVWYSVGNNNYEMFHEKNWKYLYTGR